MERFKCRRFKIIIGKKGKTKGKKIRRCASFNKKK